ncbi:MAG TPA: tetratricopeptide repeat protein [Polyangiales bacterium]|jgi:hypothetical protein
MSKRALRTQAARKSKRLRPVRGSQPSPPVDQPSIRTSHTVRRNDDEAPESIASKSDEDDSREIETANLEAEPFAPSSTSSDVTVSSLLAQHASEQEDQLLNRFFSSPPAAPSDAFDEPAHQAMSAGSRRAMWTALGVFAASLLSIGGYTVYQQWIMPTPVELGVAGDPGTSPVANLPLTPVGHAAAVEHRPPPSAAEETAVLAAASPEPTPELPSAATGAELPPSAAEASAAVPPPSAAEPSAAAPPPSAAGPAEPGAATETTVQAITDARSGDAPTEPPPAEPEAQRANAPSYDDLLEVGRTFARKERNSQALEAFQRALDARPNAPAALSGIAYVYLNLGDRTRAKDFATRALEADPKSSQGWIVLGAVEDMLGNRSAAREAYRKCASDGLGSYVAECRNLAR